MLPVTICNSHAVMPSTAMFPVQAGDGKLRVVVHDVLPYVEGRTEQELSDMVRDVIEGALPEDQLPLEVEMDTS